MTTELRHLLRWIEANADTLDVETGLVNGYAYYRTVTTQLDGVIYEFTPNGLRIGGAWTPTTLRERWAMRRFVRRMHRAQRRADRAHVAGVLRGIVTKETV